MFTAISRILRLSKVPFLIKYQSRIKVKIISLRLLKYSIQILKYLISRSNNAYACFFFLFQMYQKVESSKCLNSKLDNYSLNCSIVKYWLQMNTQFRFIFKKKLLNIKLKSRETVQFSLVQFHKNLGCISSNKLLKNY